MLPATPTPLLLALALGLLVLLTAAPAVHAVFSQSVARARDDADDPRVRNRYIIMSHKGADADVFGMHIADVRLDLAMANVKYHAAVLKSKEMRATARAKRNMVSLASLNPDGIDYEQAITHLYHMNDRFGYAATLSPAAVLKIRKETGIIASIERDGIMRIKNEQHNAPWGLSRISHGKKPGVGAEKSTYHYPDSAGTGVTAYIIDTGVYTSHKDFNGRATWGKTFASFDPTNEDGNGHGTHVAGTVGGLAFGVAKAAKIVAVKVLGFDGSGTTSDVISGIIWSAEDHARRVKEAEGSKNKTRSVANMSLGGSPSKALDDAVDFAVNAGVQFAIAAGNEYSNACNTSPARAESAITVGATSIDDALADFSNHGRCVDILAPGVDITSAWIGAPDAMNTISGTSMASPHVCGLLALTFSEHPDVDFDHKSLLQHILDAATRGAIKKLPKKGHRDGGANSLAESNNVQPNDDTIEDSGEGKTPNRLAYVFDSHDNEPTDNAGDKVTEGIQQPVLDAFEQSVLGENTSAFSPLRGLVPFF